MKMSTQDIIKNDIEVKRSKFDWKSLYAFISNSLDNNTSRIIREKNTLLWLILGRPHMATLIVFNADDTKQLIQNFKVGLQALKIAGFKLVNLDTTNSNLVGAASTFGYKTQVTKKAKSNGLNDYDCLISLDS